MINPIAVNAVKLASNFLVASGVSTMVGYAAKSSVPKVAPLAIRKIPVAVKTFHVWQKFAIPAGAAALAGFVAEKAVTYAEEQIDDNVAMAERWIAQVNEKVAKANKENDDSKTESDSK